MPNREKYQDGFDMISNHLSITTISDQIIFKMIESLSCQDQSGNVAKGRERKSHSSV